MRHNAVEQALQQRPPTLLRIHSRPVSCQAVGNVDYHVWALRCRYLEAVDVCLLNNSSTHWKQHIWVQFEDSCRNRFAAVSATLLVCSSSMMKAFNIAGLDDGLLTLRRHSLNGCVTCNCAWALWQGSAAQEITHCRISHAVHGFEVLSKSRDAQSWFFDVTFADARHARGKDYLNSCNSQWCATPTTAPPPPPPLAS